MDDVSRNKFSRKHLSLPMHLNNVPWFLLPGLPRYPTLAKALEMLGKGSGNIIFFSFIFMTKKYRFRGAFVVFLSSDLLISSGKL